MAVYRLTQALATAARQLGATVLEETPVGGLLQEGNRVTGVRLQDRDIRADTTVLATGAWTRLLGDPLGVSLPTKPADFTGRSDYGAFIANGIPAGGLFTGASECPRFSRTARAYLLRAGELDWKEINPDIFGSMIQAVADDDDTGKCFRES